MGNTANDANLTGDQELLLVTGPSGAGRATAIRALEDLGYEAIDNLPLRMVPVLLDGPAGGRPIALGVDVRNRDFNVTALIELIDTLTADPRVTLQLLYLDCGAPELLRRYSETRRRHPLAPEDSAEEGIAREYDLLVPIRARADHLIDTSEMSPHDLKAELAEWFHRVGTPGMAVSVQSFSYKRGVPRGLDMIFDCRFLQNPHWVPALRGLDGRDSRVADHVTADPRFADFSQKLYDLLLFLLPAHKTEGKAHLSIGFGCTGGQHRSVALAEIMGNALAEAGWSVSKRHRELERKSAAGRP